MKKYINEPEIIGGQGSMTLEEEVALTKYFAEKKLKATIKQPERRLSKKKRSELSTQ